MMLDFELPIHPRTGLKAVGLLRNGAPVWPALGGSEDDVIISDATDTDAGAVDADTADTSAADADDDSDDGDDKPLGPAGEKALTAEKERRRAAARLRREAIRERDDALAELDKLRKSMPKPAAAKGAAKEGDEDKADAPDLDAIRAEAEEKATARVKAEVLKDRVGDKIEILAAKRFQDASDAVTHLLRTSEIEDFLDGGSIDAEAIKEALDELLEKKPYLAVAAQGGKRFQGSGDGGARKGPQGPSQLTEADMKRMSPEAIVKAHDEGRFNDLLGAP